MKIAISLEVEAEIKKSLKIIAKAEGRSLNKQCEIFLREAVLRSNIKVFKKDTDKKQENK